MAESGSGTPRKTPSNKTREIKTEGVALRATKRGGVSLLAAKGASARKQIRKNKNLFGMR
jgi:hypothetical protein